MEIWACSTMDDSFLNWCIKKNRYLYPKLSWFYFFSQFNIAILSPMCASSGSELSIFILRGVVGPVDPKEISRLQSTSMVKRFLKRRDFGPNQALYQPGQAQTGLRNIWHGFLPLGDTLRELGLPAGKKKVPTLESLKYLKHTWMIWDFNESFWDKRGHTYRHHSMAFDKLLQGVSHPVMSPYPDAFLPALVVKAFWTWIVMDVHGQV